MTPISAEKGQEASVLALGVAGSITEQRGDFGLIKGLRLQQRSAGKKIAGRPRGSG